MFSKRDDRFFTAAWRISLWAGLAFALGTLAIMVVLHSFVSKDIQHRTDTWLTGEIEVLGNVAEHTPRNKVYSRVLGEVAELAGHEIPNHTPGAGPDPNAIFFLQTGIQNKSLWVGTQNVHDVLDALHATPWVDGEPQDVTIRDCKTPYRVATAKMEDGSRIYLGLSEKDDLSTMNGLYLRLAVMGSLIFLIGFGIVFIATRAMLTQVKRIADAASRIGQTDLQSRVPESHRRDEIGLLSRTLNRMLDRIEATMNQLHTITDALAHDIRSPLTAVRGKLEMALTIESGASSASQIETAIEEIDRLGRMLTTTLDVAEAEAGALRLDPQPLDLGKLIRMLADLYGPAMEERQLSFTLECASTVYALADEILLHRVISNLLDNEVKHLPRGSSIEVTLEARGDNAVMTWSDNGQGFSQDTLSRLFVPRQRGNASDGYGLGLAFVRAVARAHGGDASAGNHAGSGGRIVVELPLAPEADGPLVLSPLA